MDDDLGVAWLVKRLIVSKILKSRIAPDIADVDGAVLEASTAGRIVWRSMVPAIVKRLVGQGDLESEMAEEYAHRLGEDLDDVSAKALKQGYNASLGKGIDRSLSWARVSEAWGLDGRQMRAFIGAMPKSDTSGEVVPPRARATLDTMINTRADRIKDNESYAIGQLAQQVHWIKMQETGEVGPDVTKRWHTAADEFVCPVCGPINGKIVGLTKTFSRGVFAPPVHPNCRCWVELIHGSTVVTKRDYDRDQKGQFATHNTLTPRQQRLVRTVDNINARYQEQQLKEMLAQERAHWANQGYNIEDQPNGDFIVDLKSKKNKVMAYDIDGTVNVGPYGSDQLNERMAQQIRDHKAQGYKIVYNTSRPEASRKHTEKWLAENNLPNDGLYMRSQGNVIGSKVINAGRIEDEIGPIISLWDDNPKARDAIIDSYVEGAGEDWKLEDGSDIPKAFAPDEFDMSHPEGHPFGRDTIGQPRPTKEDIARMKKESAPLKGGKGGFDIVGGNPQGSYSFGSGISLVPTRDEKYYQMHYRDWHGKKIEHDLFSPDEYFARTWAMGIPYTQPREEDVFTPQEREQRAKEFKEIEGRWAENVRQARAEGRAPSMPSEEDLRTYWHWDPAWAGAQGKWEGKYREFHASPDRPPVSQHKMARELAFQQAEIDEKNKKMPVYEGLQRNGKKISYTPVAEDYNEAHGYPLRDVKIGDLSDPAWAEFASDYDSPEAALNAYKEDRGLPGLIAREHRAKEGSKVYRESQQTKVLAEVHNRGQERNAQRSIINPRKYQQSAKLRRLRRDIEQRDAAIRSDQIFKSATRTYARDQAGQFASYNTLVHDYREEPRFTPAPQASPAGPPRRPPTRRPVESLLTPAELREIERQMQGKTPRPPKQVKFATLNDALNSVVNQPDERRNLRGEIGFEQAKKPQAANKMVQATMEDVREKIYDAKVRAGQSPTKRDPRYVIMDLDRKVSVSTTPTVADDARLVFVNAAPHVGETVSFDSGAFYAVAPGTETTKKSVVLVAPKGLTVHQFATASKGPDGRTAIKTDPNIGLAAGDYTVTGAIDITDDPDNVTTMFTIEPVGLLRRGGSVGAGWLEDAPSVGRTGKEYDNPVHGAVRGRDLNTGQDEPDYNDVIDIDEDWREPERRYMNPDKQGVDWNVEAQANKFLREAGVPEHEYRLRRLDQPGKFRDD